MNNIESIEVTRDQSTLEIYSRDISNFKLMPSAVFYPRTTDDVQTVILHARDMGVPVSVRAGGTCMSGGSLTTGFILDLTKYMHDVAVDADARTATVGAGAYFRDIEDAAKEHGLFFAGYPSSNRICGIGGMLGNNASGEKSLRHGATGANVLELEVVLADGTVTTMTHKPITEATTAREQAVLALAVRHTGALREAIGNVKKCASGYRLDAVIDGGHFSEIPLMVGAQGTLGIITKATLRLIPIPQHTRLLIVSAQSLEDLPKIVATAYTYNPEGLETFDKNTFARARQYLAEHADRVVPYVDTNAHLFILIQVSEDTDEATATQAVRCESALKDQGYFVQAITDPTDVTAAWMVRRNSFTLMKDHNPAGYKAMPCIEDVIVPLDTLGTFIHELVGILERRQITYGFHGHIGDGSFRVVPVFDFTRVDLTDAIFGLMEEVFALIKKLRGNMSADHSDGIIRTPFLESFYGSDLSQVFADIKRIYDADNRLNPKKKVGGTREDITATLQRN
jgi:FAD/FMN-containing dehydrogenase